MRFLLAALLTLTTFSLARSDDGPAESKSLAGNWKAASVRCGGKDCTEAAGLRATFGTEKVEASYGSETLNVEYKLSAGNPFPRIEVRSGGLLAWEGIYKLDAKTLTFCVVPAGVTLPDDLETKDGDDRALVVLERVKE